MMLAENASKSFTFRNHCGKLKMIHMNWMINFKIREVTTCFMIAMYELPSKHLFRDIKGHSQGMGNQKFMKKNGTI